MVERRKQIEVRKAEIRTNGICPSRYMIDMVYACKGCCNKIEVLSSDRRDRGAEEGEGVGCSGSAAR